MHRAGSGPRMLLLHGGSGSWTHWQRSIPALATRFEVLAPDLPGFGASPDVPPDIGPAAYVDLVTTMLRDVTAGPVHLVGFSFGGALTAALAARLGSAVQAVTLLGTGGFGRPVGRIMNLHKPPADAAGRRLAAAYNLGEMMLAEPPGPVDPVVDLTLANIAATRFDSRGVSQSATLLADLGRIAAPVQLLWGACDKLAHPSVNARLQLVQATRPDAVTALIPRAGHWVQWDAPGPVNDRIVQFHTLHAKAA